MKKLLFTTSLITALSTVSSAFAGGTHDGQTKREANIQPSYSSTSTTTEAKESYQTPESSMYISVSGLDNFLDKEDLSIGATSGSGDFNNGFGVLAAVGHQTSYGDYQGMRSEIELGWRHNRIDSYDTAASTSASGEIDVYSAMANAYYDLKNESNFTPYIGAGIGAADISAINITATGTAGNQDSDDIVFAYQGIAGVGYALTKNWSVQAEYRYFGTSEASLSSSAGVDSNMNYSSNNALIGLKYSFN
jgi:OOP family OmpA-OmpF porin